MKKIILRITKFTLVFVFTISLLACGGADERKIKYLEKGKKYLTENNLDKAKIEFKNVLQIDPKFADAYFYMGLLNEKNKNLGLAIGNYSKAIELNPKYTLAKIKQAKIFVIAGTEGYLAKAKKLLDEAKQAEPDNLEVDLVLATIEYKTGSKKEAIKQLEKIVKEDIYLEEAISLLANVYLVEGNEAKAEVLLKRGVADNAKSVSLLISLAKLLAKNEDITGAENYLKQAIKLEPEKYFLQIALSTLYANTNQLNKAEDVLRKAITQDDENIQRYLVLVEFLISKVSFKKGSDELELAIKNKPKLFSLKFAQVKIFEKTGKRDQAKQVLENIIAEKTYEVEGVKARNILANLLLQEGNEAGAEKYAEEVLSEYPNNNDALFITSKISLKNFDATSAINGLRTVVKNAPKNAEASLLLAQAHELNKETLLAENELKKAIEINPSNVQVHVNYARYLGSKGRVDEAVSLVDKALIYFKNNYDLLDIKLKIVASQGKESEVLAILNMMEQADATKADVNITKGQYYLSKRDIDAALEQFEKAYLKTRDKFKPLQLIVKVYVGTKQADKALARLQQRLDKDPNDAMANLLMGQVYLSQKKKFEAKKKFKQSIKQADSWFLPYVSLAGLYSADGETDKALLVFKKAEKKLVNKVPAQMQIASIYEKKKQYRRAMDVYKRILEANENNKLAANNYASLLLDYGEPSELAMALELAKSFEKMTQPALQDTLGWAYAKTGDAKKAVEILKPIVEGSPKIAVFRYHLGYALYEMGEKSAAKSHLEIAVSSKQVFPGKDNAKTLLK